MAIFAMAGNEAYHTSSFGSFPRPEEIRRVSLQFFGSICALEDKGKSILTQS
jgi:hypothetical protein